MGKEENTDFICIDEDFAYGKCSVQCDECKCFESKAEKDER